MHPEVKQDKPGRCPQCGMALVPENAGPSIFKSYLPLIVVIGLIFLVSVLLAWQDYGRGDFSVSGLISYFMTGFFIVFAGFKLMDLKGFASGYFTYDLLAQRFFAYGYIYPFLELAFGFSMLLSFQPLWLLWFEFGVMVFSGIGVAIKLMKREQFHCVCLGTFLKVPLTKVTLVEDFGMAALALALILLGA